MEVMLIKLCVTDSDFLIALVKEDDVNHQVALHVFGILKKEGARIIYPVTSIIEAATALLRRYNLPQLAQALLEKYQNPEVEVVDAKQSEFINSIQYFNANASKQHTPFDCLVLSIAKIYKADVILGFDKFFQKKGFKTPKDLLG